MKSFPSSFTKDNLVQEGLVSVNLKTTLKNIAGNIMNNINSSGESGGNFVTKESLGQGLNWENFDYNKMLSIESTDYANNAKIFDVDTSWTHQTKIDANRAFHENARKIPALTLVHINKYRKIYLNAASHVGPLMKGASGKEAQEYYAEGVSPSLFNGVMGVRAQGITQHTPLMFSEGIDYSSTNTATKDGSVNSISDEDQASINEKTQKEQEERLKQNASAAREEKINELKRTLTELDKTIESYKTTIKQLETEKNKIGQKGENSNDDDQQMSAEDIRTAKAEFDKNTIQPQRNQLTAAENEKTELTNELAKISGQSDEEYVADVIAAENDGGSNNAFNYRKFSGNSRPGTPLGDISGTDGKDYSKNAMFVQLSNDDFDFTDCSIKTLVALSNGKTKDGNPVPLHQTLGRATYRYADFMFCKDLGKVSNNHLITLRKFNKPVGDNIFKLAGDAMPRELASTGKLVTWFGTEDNKLEDICKYDYQMKWEKKEAKLEDVQSQEDDSRILPSIANMLSPSYNKMFSAGQVGNNAVYGWVAGKVNLYSNKLIGHDIADASGDASAKSALYFKDANKVYEPKNTIRDTHMYNGELTFNHEFSLKFSYVLRSYDGINPKSAFLDLLGNILSITYKNGTFWGGGVRFMGAPRNKPAWNKINQLFGKLDKGMHAGIDSLFGCSNLEELGSLISSAWSAAGQFISGAVDSAKNMINNGGMKKIAKKGAHQAADVLQGMLKNKLGRPAVYAINSMLSGDNVGLWHVTVGNPRNPILSMGNLILTGATIEHKGVLGLDDFPTELCVTVKLKHGRSRDAQEIGNMYTCGQGGLLIPLNAKQKHMFFDANNPDEALGLKGYGVTNTTSADLERIWESLG